jgi:hypothetical protein
MLECRLRLSAEQSSWTAVTQLDTRVDLRSSYELKRGKEMVMYLWHVYDIMPLHVI